jgi:hypothetical protein
MRLCSNHSARPSVLNKALAPPSQGTPSKPWGHPDLRVSLSSRSETLYNLKKARCDGKHRAEGPDMVVYPFSPRGRSRRTVVQGQAKQKVMETPSRKNIAGIMVPACDPSY